MAATKTHRESITDKAERLIDAGRFEAQDGSNAPDFWVGTCAGDHGIYAVFAISPEFMQRNGLDGGRVGCTCESGRRRRLCSHATGAEELRLRGEGE